MIERRHNNINSQQLDLRSYLIQELMAVFYLQPARPGSTDFFPRQFSRSDAENSRDIWPTAPCTRDNCYD